MRTCVGDSSNDGEGHKGWSESIRVYMNELTAEATAISERSFHHHGRRGESRLASEAEKATPEARAL